MQISNYIYYISFFLNLPHYKFVELLLLLTVYILLAVVWQRVQLRFDCPTESWRGGGLPIANIFN